MKDLGNLAYADTSEKQTEAVAKMESEMKTKAAEGMGSHAQKIVEATRRIHAQNFNDFKAQLTPMLAELTAQDIDIKQQRIALQVIRDDLDARQKEVEGLKAWMPEVIDSVDEAIKALGQLILHSERSRE